MTKRLVAAAVATLLLVALGRLVFWLVFERASPGDVAGMQATPGATPIAFDQITVSSVDGVVERRSGDAAWARLNKGDTVQQRETIRTDATGRAVLQVGNVASVQVSPRSQFAVAEITRTVARARIDEGRISAEVSGSSGAKLKIETTGSDAVAQTSEGAIDVLADGKGQMTVSARRGVVHLTAKDKTVEVKAGSQSVAAKNLPPSEPTAVPASLFLKLGDAPARLQRERTTTVTGTTSQGAVISINGVRIQADATGEFKANIELKEGENPLVVSAEDVAGHTQIVNLPSVTVKNAVEKVTSKARWAGKPTKAGKVKW